MNFNTLQEDFVDVGNVLELLRVKSEIGIS